VRKAINKNMFLSYSILTKVLEGKFTRGFETGEALA
jgi:hypothetical protein